MSISESFKNLLVSEECFNDVIKIIEELINEAEGIMDLRKESKRKMLSTWVNAQNREAAEASNKFERARRTLRNAIKAHQRGSTSVPVEGSKAVQDLDRAQREFNNKVQAQQRAQNSTIGNLHRRIRIPLSPEQKEAEGRNS